MADPLRRAYLLLKEATEDQEDVMTVSGTRSPTEIEAEQVNMLEYLPVKNETHCQIQNLTQETPAYHWQTTNTTEFDTTSQLLHAQKNKQAFYYNNGTKELQPLKPGSTVHIHPPKYSHHWTQATVDKQVGVRSYQVITDDGRVYRRNRRHLRLTAEVPKQSPPAVEISSSDPGPLPLPKVEQVPPEAELMPQKVVKPQAAPSPQADDFNKSRKM